MKSKEVLAWGVCILLSSCGERIQMDEIYANAELFDNTAFSKTVALEGKTLDMGTVMRPSGLQVYDSLLVTVERKADYVFHIYNLNTNQEINSCCTIGQGPDEFMMPELVDNDRRSVAVYDYIKKSIYEYSIEDFICSKTPKPIKVINVDAEVSPGSPAVMDDGYVLYSDRPECFLHRIDAKGCLKEYPVTYPESPFEMTDYEKFSTYLMNFTTNQKNRLAIVYNQIDMVEIYDEYGNLKKRLHGPDVFYSKRKEQTDGRVILTVMDGYDDRDAYFCPRNVGEGFIVSYNGQLADDENHHSYQNTLYYFDWEGTPVAKYSIDDGVFRFDVDPVRRKIYGISTDPEYHIVEYCY